MGLSKHNCREIVFIGLTMTTCFGRAWPFSDHKLVHNLTMLKRKSIHEIGLLKVVLIRGIQRDRVEYHEKAPP